MSAQNQPIIVGAGPVGLGAALFLAKQGQTTRVIEILDRPSEHSKALAVNPRTLDILEPSGLTQEMLQLGSPVGGVHFYRQGRPLVSISLAGIHPRYPFMLGLSQAVTARLLARAATAGGGVERGVRMVECRQHDSGVEVTLERVTDKNREVVACPWLLAADGAHSTARQQLGIDFVGSSFVNEWHLADVPLKTSLAEDQAHIFFLDGGGFLFLFRVIMDFRNESQGPRLWRVISTRPEPLTQLVNAEAAGPPVWFSSFHISHRINRTLAAGRVYFAGDAAHIHSPVGARGVNLGLEDAWVFSRLLKKELLDQYDRLRRPVDSQVC
jgi:2-polyprenyl-6-methoxyphenol hydroxylase-like FAD-dependent oxidoreductase